MLSSNRFYRTFQLIAATLSLFACSADPEITQLSSRETEQRFLDSETLDALAELADIAGIGLVVRDTRGTLTPSAAIAGAMFPDEQPPQPNQHAENFEVPEVEYDPGVFLPTLHARMTSLDKRSLGVWLDPEAVHGQIILDGGVHVHTAWPWPDGDVILDRVTIDVAVAVHGGQLSVAGVAANVKSHVENCGAFGWCSSIASSVMPDLSSKVRDAIAAKLNEVLPRPEVGQGLTVGLEQLTNALSPAGVRWNVAQESIETNSKQLKFTIWRDVDGLAAIVP